MQDESPRRTQAQRRAETRRALIAAARTLFAEKGYADTGTADIVKAASVTRGALYHHFTDKAEVFRAVLYEEAEAIADEITQVTSTEQSPEDAFMDGARAYFSAMTAPGRARLLLLEGPSVLGVDAMREIDRATGGQTLVDGLRHAQSAGALHGLPVEAMADLLSAAFDRAALAIARNAPEKDYEAAIRALLTGILHPGPATAQT
ncbi:MAG: TetR/AcrR family transcriptional regulator [Roseibium sp.]|nr:TetR/AcrR family transcriptional regulator [Roseibium sp.]